jgi:formylglycine-generating enzyme required for sulfatase activity
VEDCWHGNYYRAPTDGSAWITGDCKYLVLRGGTWLSKPEGIRSATRGIGSTKPETNNDQSAIGYRFSFSLGRKNNNGFRLARTLSP